MAIWKKAISTVTSAALLASLFAAGMAPAALASISSTSAGNVAQGTTSAGTASYLFTENSIAALPNAAGTITVTITPNGGGPGTVDWAGTPVVSAPDSLGATASIAGNVLTVNIKASDVNNVETIQITGLKVKASSGANPGAVVATLGGTAASAFTGTTATAAGTLQSLIGTTLTVNTTSACGFLATGGNNTTATFGSQTGVTITGVAGSAPGVQTVNISAALSGSHVINEAVSQTVDCVTTTLTSPATVVTAAKVTYTTLTVFPGENNADAGTITLTGPNTKPDFFAKSSTVTYTIATAGVVFSKAPTVPTVTGGGTLAVSIGALSADRKSIVVTVDTVSSVVSNVITLQNITYDVAATVPGGTFVDVNVTFSGGLVTGNPAQNAVVSRGITASAPTPTVYIGENNQATGLVTLAEQGAGFFQSGTGANNILQVCTTGAAYSYTFTPWAKVTVGDLRLREGSVASPDNIVQASLLANGCYGWTVWTASTVASTIVIGNDSFASGPLINVTPGQAPGIVAMHVRTGNGDTVPTTETATVGFAVAAFKTQVAVTALAQPTIPAGAVTKAGAIQIAETANGQLKADEQICFEIMPRGSTANIQAKYDTLISALNTAQLPVVTASGGLVVGPVVVLNESCSGANIVPSYQVISFAFNVLQQSTAGTGKLVADNINLITLADAANGPVLFNVWGRSQNNTKVDFQAQVSNAKIGVKPAVAINATSALGLMPNQGAWSTATKVAAANKYITWRFQGGSALAGKTVQIQVAVKNSAGGWGPFVVLTSRLADSSGTAYFQWRSTNQWVSVRAYYPGDTAVAESWSAARQGRWK